MGIGVLFGKKIGAFTGIVIFYFLAGNSTYDFFCGVVNFLVPATKYYSSGCSLSPERIRKAFEIFNTIFSAIGMLVFGVKMLEVHEKYFYLREIKTVHAYRFDKYRKYFFEINNAYLDMVWALLYVLLISTVPLIAGTLAGFFVFLMFSYFLYFFAVIPAIVAFFCLYTWANNIIWTLLHPHRIEAEIRIAPDIAGMFERREQERLLGEGDDHEEKS